MTLPAAERMTTEQARSALCSTLECLLELAARVHTGDLVLRRQRPNQGFLETLLDNHELQDELMRFLGLAYRECHAVYQQLGGSCDDGKDFAAAAQMVALEAAPPNGSTLTH